MAARAGSPTSAAVSAREAMLNIGGAFVDLRSRILTPVAAHCFARRRSEAMSVSSAASGRQQAHRRVGALFLQCQEDRGVALGPAAADRLDQLLLAERGEPHRRIGGARQLER